MEPVKILIIATSHEQMGDSHRRTGLWLEELAVPYYIFRDAGAIIILASPKGGLVPLDPKSESIIASSPTIRRFQKDPEAISCLSQSVILSTLKAEDFDLVFILGGHGAIWDFPSNIALKQLLESFNLQDKFIGAVCHGAAAFLPLKNRIQEPLIKGRQVTSFSNSEEQSWGLTSFLPFLLESELISLGASYSKGPNFESHTVVDGNIITGQNPVSSKEVAKRLLVCFKESSKRVEAAIQ
jgi:putative intracellular protease/amidase